MHNQLLIIESNKHAIVLPSYNYQLFINNILNKKNKCITINDKNDTTLYHETTNVRSRPTSGRSDVSQDFERDDIFTWCMLSQVLKAIFG